MFKIPSSKIQTQDYDRKFPGFESTSHPNSDPELDKWKKIDGWETVQA